MRAIFVKKMALITLFKKKKAMLCECNESRNEIKKKEISFEQHK